MVYGRGRLGITWRAHRDGAHHHLSAALVARPAVEGNGAGLLVMRSYGDIECQAVPQVGALTEAQVLGLALGAGNHCTDQSEDDGGGPPCERAPAAQLAERR